ncbi:MAG TPA: hypothetical protein VHJ78_01070, partial [Actinomycetota bacterium]|nr:hypothetical protein [Actinomycetota bacterium]
GIQVLPALGVALSVSKVDPSQRPRVMWMAVSAYFAVAAVSVLQTFQGRAPLDLGLLSGMLLAGALLLAGVALMRLITGSRPPAGTAQ